MHYWEGLWPYCCKLVFDEMHAQPQVARQNLTNSLTLSNNFRTHCIHGIDTCKFNVRNEQKITEEEEAGEGVEQVLQLSLIHI